MIAIYNDDGRINQVMSLYPQGYLEGLPAHGMKGVVVPEEMRPLTAAALINQYYVSDDELVERPLSILPDEINLAVGESISFPELGACQVTFDDQVFDVAAGEFELSAGAPGEYDLYVRCFPMQDKLAKVIVT